MGAYQHSPGSFRPAILDLPSDTQAMIEWLEDSMRRYVCAVGTGYAYKGLDTEHS